MTVFEVRCSAVSSSAQMADNLAFLCSEWLTVVPGVATRQSKAKGRSNASSAQCACVSCAVVPVVWHVLESSGGYWVGAVVLRAQCKFGLAIVL